MSELISQTSRLVREEFDIQITTAKAYPRNTENFVKDATNLAIMDQETAESCIYSLPRKDRNGEQTFIKGESIRLAEIVASTWGNLHAATRIIENDGRFITAEAVAWDLEKNIKISKQIRRSILTSSGKTYSQDMQTVTGNAASSIALRNAILSVIPRALVKRVYEAAVQFAIGDQTKLSQRVKSLFDRFKKLGIGEDKILNYFNKKSMSEITADEVEEMIGIGTSIKDKITTIDKAFEIVPDTIMTNKTATLNSQLDNPNQDFINEMDGKV